MSRLGCTCGHIIRDQTDELSYKAEFIKDKDFFNYLENCQEEIQQAINLIQSGKSEAWINENSYNPKEYFPPAWELLTDRLMGIYYRYLHYFYECENCGKLWIQKQGTEEFISFSPDTGHYMGILDKK